VLPRFPALAAAVALGCLAAPALAQAPPPPPPGGVLDLVGVRALATSAGTAGTSGTEALFTNPGAMGVRTGYVAETLGLNERRGSETTARYLGALVVDGVSAPVATSVGFLKSMAGDTRGSIFYLGFSGPLADSLHIGAQGRYLKLTAPAPAENFNAVTADAGLSWDASSYVTLGVAGFNLIPTGHDAALPLTVGAGLAVGSDTSIRVLLDWKRYFLPNNQDADRFAAGVGALLGGAVALRAGWMHDGLLSTSWWSAGAGLVAGDGFAIDAGYKQSIDVSSAREMALSLRYYPPQ
jgi:hypothetical protein